MTELSKEQINALFEQIGKNIVPLSLNANEEDVKKAEETADEYIKNGNKSIDNIYPLSIYFIISKLPEDKQIEFIKQNITYIKEHNDDIFLYTMLVPKPLSYFLSFRVLRELRNIDKDIFKKIICKNYENLFNGFNHEDYYIFYTEFYDELVEVENREFINGLYFHNRCCYDDILDKDVNMIFNLQRMYNKEFINFILEKYKDKINEFTPQEILIFIKYIEDNDIYKDFINKNYEILNYAFCNILEYDLKDYLSETNETKQEILIFTFFDSIIKHHDIKRIIDEISPNIIIELYNQNKDLFKLFTLNDWIKICVKNKVFNDSFKEILDTFEINDIELLFDTKFYISYMYKEKIEALKYIETKYRSNIKINGMLEKIDYTTSIFSDGYLKNLSEIKEMLKNNTISKISEHYKQHLVNFILFLINNNIVNNIRNKDFIEIEKLFYRIVKGKSIAILYELSGIEDIAIINRLGQIDFKVKEFTVDQLEHYNVKHHKQLYKQFEINNYYIKDYKRLILKLIFIVGFNNAKILLENDNTLPVLEHLVGNVDVKNVLLDEYGNPILNTEIMNLLFNDKSYDKIKKMLSNKDNDLYKYFPRIFNEWELIKMNIKTKSLKSIINFLKCDEITLPPKYYRLEGQLKYIGCGNNIVNETLFLHDQILKRISSTIPRIMGTKDEYSYEILRLDDMEALTVGNKTNCCFTVLGHGYSCLKHAVTSINGRILVIKKDNQILAHSWVWRNGNLLCFDNIEVSKSINYVEILDIYLQIADEFIKTSYEFEGVDSCIKNITIGFTKFDKFIVDIKKYPCFISKSFNIDDKNFENRLGNVRQFLDLLPQPNDYLEYSDSKNVQYLIRGNGIFNLGQSYFRYQDDRKEVMHYLNGKSYDEDYLLQIIKKVNALRYINAENNNTLEFYKAIDIKDLKEVYCNGDWYFINYLNDDIEIFNNSLDKRSRDEMDFITKKYSKNLKL